MKITTLKMVHVPPRWLLLRVETDEGVVGYGEPIVEGRARTVEQAVRELEPYLIGHDPRRIEAIWQRLYKGSFYRGGPILASAVSGVDHALWDIKGKWLGAPVYELIGGRVRDRIACYAHVATGSSDQYEIAVAEGAEARVQEGFSAVKLGVPAPMAMLESPERIESVARVFAAVRDRVGPKTGIAIDFHGRVAPTLARQIIRAIEPYTPLFVEEPVLAEELEAMADIARFTHIPIATGERMYTRWGFKQLFEQRAASIIQPDPSHAGGISETRRIAAAAETYGIGLAPHNPLGPVNLAVCLQIDACTPNFTIQELAGREDGRDLGVGIIRDPFKIVDGSIEVPEGPGLGIDIDWDDLVDRSKSSGYDGSWETPQLEYADGSFAPW